MNSALFMCYDLNRKTVGDVAALAAAEYARYHSMDFVNFEPARSISPWFYKVYAALRARCYDYAMVIDADVVMRQPRKENAPPWCKRIAMSTNWAGICTGFFVTANNPVSMHVLETWMTVGESIHERYRGSPKDEASLKILCDNFRWINKAVAKLPSRLVSSPENGIVGTLAHHFVASAFDANHQATLAAQMMDLIRRDRIK